MTEWTDEEIEMFRSETFGIPKWQSGVCRCQVTISTTKLRVISCDYEHFIWCWRVGVLVVISKCKLRSAAIPPDNYRIVLDNYLEWGRGMSLSFGTVLGSYQHGKASREWHIKEWKQDIADHLVWPEEFLDTLGVNKNNFASIFGREPITELLDAFTLFEPEKR